MAIVPVRDIAKGVVTDVDPYSLPVGVWSWGSNVRFRNNTVTRAPVFKTVNASLLQSSPRFLAAIIPTSGLDQIVIGYLNGDVSLFSSGTETNASISGYTTNTADTPFTFCHCGGVQYINRGDRAPWALLPSSSTFEALPNWAPVDGPWTCNILRASNSALCAFGLVQDGVSYPNMIITSEFAEAGAVPTTWDYTLGTNNATQNNLAEMEGPITDACSLGDDVIIYGQNETWIMFLSGDDNIWDYEPLFSDQGAINANCAVEVDKKHFVFGLNDIWMHDGNSKVSICDEKTREFIFNGLNVTNSQWCSVTYNKNLKEIYFRYPSSDQYCSFLGANDGCNRQAVYHIPTGTWSFDDLPFVFGATMANLDTTRTWTQDTLTWAQSGGTWASLDDTERRVMCMIGDVSTQYNLVESLYAFDLQGPGAQVNYAVDTNATLGWTLIRDGIDLHEIGKDLRGYVQLSSIYPQARLQAGAEPIQFSFGTSDYYGVEPPTMSAVQTFDGDTLYKLDYNADGRYLSMTIAHPDYHWVSFTGFDLDLDVLAEF